MLKKKQLRKLQLSAYVISNNYHPDGMGDAAVERLLSKLKEMGYKCKKDRKKRGSDIALTSKTDQYREDSLIASLVSFR